MASPQRPQVEPIALGARSAARALDTTVGSVYRMIRKGDLPSFKLPAGGLRIPVSAIKKLIDDANAKVASREGEGQADRPREAGSR